MAKVLFLFSILFLVSCVFVPQKSDIGLSETHDNYKTCEKAGVAVTFVSKLYSDFSLENKVESTDVWRGSRNPSGYVLKKLNDTNFVVTPPTEKVPQRYFINFIMVTKTYQNYFQRATLWISDLTLGILPGWGDGEYYLVAEVHDRDGNKINEYKSSVLPFDYYHGLLLLPFNSYRRTRANLNETFLPKLTSEIIDSMKKDKLFDCI